MEFWYLDDGELDCKSGHEKEYRYLSTKKQ